MKNVGAALFVTFLLPTFAPASFGQVSMTSRTYSQNFDGLVVTASSMPWSNNVTLRGWYAHEVTKWGGPVSYVGTTSKYGTSIALYGDTPDYALGSGYDHTSGHVLFGVRLVNNTGVSVSNFSISYIGEQWRRESNVAQAADSLAFSYRIFTEGTGSLVAQNWIDVPSLNFISPDSTVQSAADLDGNAPANRLMFSSWIAGVTLAEGQELWLRWTAADNAVFNDHGLAIDDLTVTLGAIPEPATYTLGFGALALFMAIRKKRHSESGQAEK